MRLRRMFTVAGAVVLIVATVRPLPVQASGGGGCGGPITEDRGTEVAISNFCFSPTVLHARPGDTVTWTNEDGVQHNVAGANLAWGSFQMMRAGRTVSYDFDEPGVYSYVCSLHPGMVGTVVVGEAGAGTLTALDAELPITPVSASRADERSGDDAWPGGLVVILAALVGLLLGVRWGRRTRA